ncbi:MAG: hypothetical protein FWH19_04450 [Treponema sp.]|nr:hypothetical protein [Treponema sp.]
MKAFIMVFFLAAGILPIMADSLQIPMDWRLLWTGSWYNSLRTEEGDLPPVEEVFSGGILYNRGDLRLSLPQQDLALRFLATDKRLVPFEENDGRAGFNPALGLYYRGTGSLGAEGRFLYGVQSEFGLPARINNVWLRSVPFVESRQPSSRDLKAEPAARDRAESYLYLALPLFGMDVFASAALDEEQNPAIGSGIGLEMGGAALRFEGFYTQKTLPPRNASTWFSPSPPLPERDFEIYALGTIFQYQNISFASDWAFSETFAWGEGVYGNAALRLESRPWRFSLAGDGATGRFADRSGSSAGAAFRLAGRAEHFWPRSGLLRLQSTIRAPALDEDFNRGNFSVYYRPSAPGAAERRENPNKLRFSRASLSLNRDARRPDRTADSISGLAGFILGPFNSTFTGSLQNTSSLADDGIPLFSAPAFESFDSFRVSGELGWRPAGFPVGSLDLRARLGHTTRAEKENLWDLSLNCSLRPGKWGRIGLRAASTDFPRRWNYTLSWRLEQSF